VPEDYPAVLGELLRVPEDYLAVLRELLRVPEDSSPPSVKA